MLAVVRGSAVNQDGASNGLTAPNGPSQERVIGRALASAGLLPGMLMLLEGHGTGTRLGDPIEAQALLATYGQGRPEGRPLWLGSVKSNIGHAQAAAGVAGVIKMVKALEHSVLPKTLHVDEPSTHVDWSAGEVRLLREPVPWVAEDKPRRAGVSSFGVSGTNAHVIIEEAPPVEVGGEPAASGMGLLPVLVSAATRDALGAQAERLRSHLAGDPGVDLYRVAQTLALHRAQLSQRAVVLAGDREGLLGGLGAMARGEQVDDVVQGVAGSGGRVVFVFSGQGSQWVGMGEGLWESSRVFAEHLEECVEAFSSYLDFSLEDVLRGRPGAASLERVDVVQPALFSVMISLAALWRSYGVVPGAVVGHSQGEIAAAYVAGALSLEDAVRVVALRGQVLSERLAGRGGMVSVSLPAERVVELLEPFGQRLSLAAVNGPSAVVVSGETDALTELLLVCEAEQVRAKWIAVDYASHSVQVEAVKERLEAELRSISPGSGDVPFFSSVTGGLLDTAELDAGYWYRNLRQTVQFEGAIGALIGDPVGAFVEMSPHPVLGMAVQETIEASGKDADAVAVIESLRREQGGMEHFLVSLAHAHVHGIALDWRMLFDRPGTGPVELPAYAFQRKRYWIDGVAGTGDAGSLGLSSTEHPLLGAAVDLAGGDEGVVFTGRLGLRATRGWPITP